MPSRIRRALRCRGLLVRKPGRGFERISRFSRNLRFSRRSRVISSRSAVVSPPSPLPPSESACLTHMRIDQLVQPNCSASSSDERPDRCSSTTWRRNSGVYRFWDTAEQAAAGNGRSSLDRFEPHSGRLMQCTRETRGVVSQLVVQQVKTERTAGAIPTRYAAPGRATTLDGN